MRTFTAIIERDPGSGAFIGHIPGWPGAYSQGDSREELHANLEEVIALLLQDGEPAIDSQFVGIEVIRVA